MADGSVTGLHKLRQPGCEKMEREWENGERMRKWREVHSLHFLVFFFLPSLSISHIKNCLILSQNVKYGTFVANIAKKTWHTHYKKIILGCEKAPQVVGACSVITMTSNQSHFKNLIMESWWIEFSSHAGGDDMAHVFIQLSQASIVFLALLSYYTIPHVLPCSTVLLHECLCSCWMLAMLVSCLFSNYIILLVFYDL